MVGLGAVARDTGLRESEKTALSNTVYTQFVEVKKKLDPEKPQGAEMEAHFTVFIHMVDRLVASSTDGNADVSPSFKMFREAVKTFSDCKSPECMQSLRYALSDIMDNDEILYDIETTCVTKTTGLELDKTKLLRYQNRLSVLSVDDQAMNHKLVRRFFETKKLLKKEGGFSKFLDGADVVDLYHRSIVSLHRTSLEKAVKEGEEHPLFEMLELSEVDCLAAPDLKVLGLRDDETSIFDFNVIFLDNKMTRINGTEVLKRIQRFELTYESKTGRRLPVLPIVGLSADNCPEAFIRLGAKGFVAKPSKITPVLHAALSLLPDLPSEDIALPRIVGPSGSAIRLSPIKRGGARSPLRRSTSGCSPE
jgi:CheY-like chemotaxis protein